MSNICDNILFLKTHIANSCRAYHFEHYFAYRAIKRSEYPRFLAIRKYLELFAVVMGRNYLGLLILLTYLGCSSPSLLSLSTSDLDIFQRTNTLTLTEIRITATKSSIQSVLEINFSLFLYFRVRTVANKVLPLHTLACSIRDIFLWKEILHYLIKVPGALTLMTFILVFWKRLMSDSTCFRVVIS